MKNWMKIAGVVLGLLGLSSFLSFVLSAYLNGGWRMLFGWLISAWDVSPYTKLRYETVVGGFVLLLLGLSGIHLLSKRLAAQRDFRWRWPWSVAVTVMFIAPAIVSLAFSGITQQISWLREEMGKGREFMIALRIYASDASGSFPLHLDDLVVERVLRFEDLERLMVVERGPGEVAGTWIYVADLADSYPQEIPVLIGPPMGSGGSRIICRVDSSVGMMRDDEFREMLKEVVKKNFSGSPYEIPPEYKPFLEGT